jgi:NAD(P)-dependent dehydrogenase (short-subunit alcohol dehydrogenase family)
VDITGSVALVTGGASGLGLATARRLVKAGGKAVLVDLPSSKGDEAAASLDGGAVFAAADVTDEAEVRSALDAAGELGQLRVVVNCAGIGTPGRLLGRDGTAYPIEPFVKVLQVNLIGTFNVIRLAAERMAAAEPVGEERGVIVNTASVAAYEGQIGQAAYSASKGGIVGMTLPAARDLSSVGVRVCTIAPGLVDTPLLGSLPEEARQALSAGIPFPKRLGRPDDFAELALDIVRHGYLNGEVIRMDGALRMAPR